MKLVYGQKQVPFVLAKASILKFLRHFQFENWEFKIIFDSSSNQADNRSEEEPPPILFF